MEKLFEDRDAFRSWLKENKQSDEGIWLILGKPGGPETISAQEALEEALCFGWIDGQIRGVDNDVYLKYFRKRRKKSIWSTRNRAIVERLRATGRMDEAGLEAVDEAKRNGSWDSGYERISDEQRLAFIAMVKPFPKAAENLERMPRSVQTTYTAFYLSAKREETRQKRFADLLRRFEKNLKPLERE